VRPINNSGRMPDVPGRGGVIKHGGINRKHKLVFTNKPVEDSVTDMPVTSDAETTVIGAFEAKTHLSKLLRQARAGKHFIITQRGRPVAELRPVQTDTTAAKSQRGDMSGKIWVADDFCAEMEDLREYME